MKSGKEDPPHYSIAVKKSEMHSGANRDIFDVFIASDLTEVYGWLASFDDKTDAITYGETLAEKRYGIDFIDMTRKRQKNETP